MARIRSIKPDFFTSEVIASLPLSARLTFIGLWTYVDDNGVGLDNERLIVAAVWPLEDDPSGTLRRTREDLRRLAADELVIRYSRVNRYLRITNWDEHQRISHPRKSRYPLPSDSGVTCENTSPPEDYQSPPEDYQSPPEGLRPEQGAGSREQGAGTTGAGLIGGEVEGVIHSPPQAIQLPSGPWLNGASKRTAPEPPASPRGRAETDAERRRQAAALNAWENDHQGEASGALPA